MTGTIFDAIEEPISEGKYGFMELAERENKEPGFVDTFLSELSRTAPIQIGKQALKGSIEGLSQFGRMMGPLQGETITPEQQAEILDKAIPSEDQFIPSAIRRGIKQAPSVLAFPQTSIANMLPRSLLAGFVGEGAKELGAPEWAQAAAEITAFLGPDITKKLIEKGKNADFIKAARELGLSDEAITPLMQSDFKKKWLSKLIPRRGRTEEALSSAKSELESAYGNIQKSEKAAQGLSAEQTKNLGSKIDEKLANMPSSVREKIQQDYKDLLSKPITGESLINFYVDVNHETSASTKQLKNLKEPIKEALKEIDPILAENFDTINDLYSKYYNISNKLNPNLMTDIIGASESIALLVSFVTGNAPILLKFGGEAVFRRLAREMMFNPKFQQLSSKTIESMNKGKFSTVKKLSDALSYEVRKTSPELADKLDQLSEEELMEFLQISKEN